MQNSKGEKVRRGGPKVKGVEKLVNVGLRLEPRHIARVDAAVLDELLDDPTATRNGFCRAAVLERLDKVEGQAQPQFPTEAGR